MTASIVIVVLISVQRDMRGLLVETAFVMLQGVSAVISYYAGVR